MKIKFVCLNLWFGGLFFDRIIKFIRQEQPDILAVQEAFDSNNNGREERFRSIETLRKNCDFQFFSFAPACIAVLKQGEIEAGNAVFSRFPISSSHTTFFDIPFGKAYDYEIPGNHYSVTPRNMQHEVIQVGDIELNVFNTQGIWGKDSEDTERRLQMSKRIVQEVKGKSNVILAGDFNLMPHTKSIQNIEKHLDNVFKGKINTTFNMKQKSNPVLANVVVDMIFVSRDMKITKRYCPDVDVSDHMPLVCELDVKVG